MADIITLTSEELKELIRPIFELVSKRGKQIIELQDVIEELNETILDLKIAIEKRDELIETYHKAEMEARVVPPPPADFNEEEWESS